MSGDTKKNYLTEAYAATVKKICRGSEDRSSAVKFCFYLVSHLS